MAHYNWLAQVDKRGVAHFHGDGRVELFPRDGDSIIIEKPDCYDELLDVELNPQAALALQFEALANYVGDLRASVIELLGVMPDSVHEGTGSEDDCWTWAWDTLTGDAQSEVKAARTNANNALKK